MQRLLRHHNLVVGCRSRNVLASKRYSSSYTVDTLYEGLVSGNRLMLSKAITMIESTKKEHRIISNELVSRCLEKNKEKKVKRIGFTGTPGVGKSTFIEAFGSLMLEKGHRIAVLAVDPSSTRSGGSLLGDKTRMQKISTSDNAYIRPSPSGGSLGGVARKTLETIVLTEAAGFDVVFVETVGVGQSEILVSEMVDMFVLLAQPGSGDELQGIKKGIMELADMIVVNKSDGALETPAKITTRALLDAMRLIAPKAIEWNPPVVRASAYTGYNLERVYDTINTYFQKINESNRWDDIRKTQQSHWMWREVKNLIFERLHQNKEVKSLAKDLEKGVADGTIAPTIAAYAIFEKFVGSK